MSSLVELCVDALPGPTFTYSGLAKDNRASQENRGRASNPCKAALQSLRKMQIVSDLGTPQAVLPPHERPHVATLRRLGFTGTDGQVLDACFAVSPALLASVSSASGMWVANSATVTPSMDSYDSRIHLTPANLCFSFHRMLEPSFSALALRLLLPEPNVYVHNEEVPPFLDFRDEGDANHIRLSGQSVHRALNVFCSQSEQSPSFDSPARLSRQSRLASEALTRLHRLNPDRVIHVGLSDVALRSGIFHLDMIALADRDYMLIHESALEDSVRTLEFIRERFFKNCGSTLAVRLVSEREVSLSAALDTYVFNSQMLRTRSGNFLLAPIEAGYSSETARLLADLVSDSSSPISEIRWVDVSESMANGGGPACLRLRVPLTLHEYADVNPTMVVDDRLSERLAAIVKRRYRDSLMVDDLRDPLFLDESRRALDEITQELRLGSIYDFQH